MEELARPLRLQENVVRPGELLDSSDGAVRTYLEQFDSSSDMQEAAQNIIRAAVEGIADIPETSRTPFFGRLLSLISIKDLYEKELSGDEDNGRS
jgi:hypothetical protein